MQVIALSSRLPSKNKFAIGLSIHGPLPEDPHWEGDLELLRQIRPQTLEFETSWAQIFPRGQVTVHQATLDHYDRFVDELLERGIEPRIILSEGPLPEDILDKGSYAKRDIIYNFADYATTLAKKLADRVHQWTTQKDPETHRSDKAREGWPSIHHSLLAHPFAREAIVAEHPSAKVGFGLKFSPIYPSSDRTRDHELAGRLKNILQGYYLDLLYKGQFNESAVHYAQFELSGDAEFFEEKDKHTLKNSADFLRLDYEFLPAIAAADEVSYTRSARLRHKENPKTEPYTHRLSGERLEDSLKALVEDYKMENIQLIAASILAKERTIEGRVDDRERMLYHSHHLQSAISIPQVEAYSWQDFLGPEAIVAIDDDENRILKDSAHWLKTVIETRSPYWEPGTDYKGMD